MPGFDGTGPRGEGPMTGGKKGCCARPAGMEAGKSIGKGRGRRCRLCNRQEAIEDTGKDSIG